jgi:hypothetical protein
MSQDRRSTSVESRRAGGRARIQETERLMRPPTPEALLCLQQAMPRPQEQEANLSAMLGVATPPGGGDPALNSDAPVMPRPSGLAREASAAVDASVWDHHVRSRACRQRM